MLKALSPPCLPAVPAAGVDVLRCPGVARLTGVQHRLVRHVLPRQRPAQCGHWPLRPGAGHDECHRLLARHQPLRPAPRTLECRPYALHDPLPHHLRIRQQPQAQRVRKPLHSSPALLCRHRHSRLSVLVSRRCAEYSRSASARDWASLSRSLNSLAHGHIHELMGGSWFHDFADTTHHASALSILTFAHAIQVRIIRPRSLWCSPRYFSSVQQTRGRLTTRFSIRPSPRSCGVPGFWSVPTSAAWTCRPRTASASAGQTSTRMQRPMR